MRFAPTGYPHGVAAPNMDPAAAVAGRALLRPFQDCEMKHERSCPLPRRGGRGSRTNVELDLVQVLPAAARGRLNSTGRRGGQRHLKAVYAAAADVGAVHILQAIRRDRRVRVADAVREGCTA